jgi:hypothetical protein
MEPADSLKTLVTFYKKMLHHITESSNIYSYRCIVIVSMCNYNDEGIQLQKIGNKYFNKFLQIQGESFIRNLF